MLADSLAEPHSGTHKSHHGFGTPGARSLPWNLTGQPAVTVPCLADSDNMPIGVQVVSRRWRDDVAIAVTKVLKEGFGGWRMVRVAL